VLPVEEEALAVLVEPGGGRDRRGPAREEAAAREAEEQGQRTERGPPRPPLPRIDRAPGDVHASPVR